MTTIACNKSEMAGDSQEDDEGIIGKVDKVFRIHDDLVGCAGDSQNGILFMEWYRTKGDKPDLDDDFMALVLTKDGEIFTYESKCVPLKFNGDFYAIGSGRHFAMGAMAAGSSPKKAVTIACEFSPESGPPVKLLKRTSKN